MTTTRPLTPSDDQLRDALSRRPDPSRMSDDLAQLFVAVDRTRQRRQLTVRLAQWWIRPRTKLAPRNMLAFLSVIAILVALALAIGLIVGARHRVPPPFGLARPGLIAVDKGNHIFVQDPDGTVRTQLTSGPSVDNNATFSPDGTKIAYQSRQADLSLAIVVIDADGSHPVTVADQLASTLGFAWSPDGHRLAFGGRKVGSDVARIYVGDADRSDARPLGGPDVYGVEPGWSPDGRTIVFKRLYAGEAGTTGAAGWLLDQRNPQNALWLINVDGSTDSNLHRLTPTNGEYAALWRTAWSPDGARLAFWADGAGGSTDIYVINADSTGERDISNSPSPVDEMWPTWSPDGRRIAYIHTDPAQIVLVDPNGDHAVTLDGPSIRADPMTNCGGVVWSPDGERLLAVATGPDGDTSTDVIAIFDVSGRGERTTIPAAGLCSFSWQRLAP